MHHSGLGAVLMLLAIGLLVVLLARRIGVSALIAYLATGAVVSALGLVQDTATITLLGELGAALLLFSIGMEMDLPEMRKRLGQIVSGAVLQIGLTMAAGFLAMLPFFSWQVSLTIGCCLALSSTVMVIRALDERGLRNKEVGKTVMGLLLSQDVSIAPLLIIITIVLPDTGQRPPIWLSALGIVGLVVATVFLRRFLISRLWTGITATRLPELEVAFSITIAIGAAFLADSVGLGAAVGAFCAGLAMGGDEHRHAIETSTRPLQGLMAIMFFTSVGMQFDVDFVGDNWDIVAGGLMIAVIVKVALAGFALRLAGLDARSAIGAGIMVGQVGEFSFVLAQTGPLDDTTYKLVVAIACCSLAITPLLIRLAEVFLPKPTVPFNLSRGETIVVAGLGPVGNTVVETLHSRQVPLLLVDRNPKLLAPWDERESVTCLQGRIEQTDDWLPALKERPRIVILTFPIPDTSALVAQRLLNDDPRLTIIARTPYLAQRDMLYQAGVRYVICDEAAAAEAIEPLLVHALSDADRRRTERLTVQDGHSDNKS